MKSYTDEFILAMRQAPGKKGLIVIKPDNRAPETSIRLANEISIGFVFRKVKKNTLIVKFSDADLEATSASLYLADSASPPSGKITDQPIFTRLAKPFFYNADFSEGCATIRIDEFASFLTANPSFRAKILVHDDLSTRRRRTANRWLRVLTKTYRIDSHRIHLFLRREDHSSGWSTHYSEFWIVP